MRLYTVPMELALAGRHTLQRNLSLMKDRLRRRVLGWACRPVMIGIGLCVAIVSHVGSALAVTYWQTAPTDASWSTVANWTAGIPTSSNAAIFSTSDITLTDHYGDKNAYGVSFKDLGDGIDDFTVSNSTNGVLYIYEGGITVDGGNQTFTSQVRPRTSTSIVNNGSGLLNFSNTLLVHLTGSSAVITFDGDGDIRVNRYERRTSSMDVSIVKQGAGTLTIAGAASAAAGTGQGAIDGSMSILGGTVAINNEANLGFDLEAFDAAGLLLDGGALRALASFAIDDSNRGVTLGNNGGTFDVPDAGHTLTIVNPIVGGGALTKTGAGTLALSGSNSYTGNTIVSEGTLAIGAADTLPTTTALVLGGGMDSTTVGHLDMSSSSQTVSSLQFLSNTATANTVTIGVGQTLGITGTGSLKLGQGSPLLREKTTNATFSGGGTLNVDNAAGTIDVGFRNDDQNQTGNYATLDLRGLGSFTANVDQLRVGYGTRIDSTLYLSDTDNTVVANTIQVSNSLYDNAYAGLLILGTGNNVIHVDTINIGLGKGLGTVRFASQAAGSSGTLVIADKAGTGGADIAIADNNGAWTGAHVTGTLDLRGHQVDITAGTVLVGRRNVNTDAGSATGTIWFDDGVFAADSLLLGVKSGTGTGTAAGIVNMSGGTFTVDAITLGSHSDSYGNAQGTFNLQGGTLVANTIGKGDGYGNGASDLAALNWTGGTLHVGTFGSATQSFDLNQDGGTLAPGNSVGTTIVYGNYTQAAAATLEVELAAAGLAGTDYDLVDVYGDASLEGYLDVSLLNGFAPELGDYFDVLSTTGSLYEDLTVTGDAPSSVFGWWEVSVVEGLDGAVLRLTAVPEPSSIMLAIGAVVGLFGCMWRRHR